MLLLFVLPVVTSFIGILVIYLVFQVRKILEDEQRRNSISPNIEVIWKNIPITASAGWNIDSVVNGVTVWWRKERRASMQNGLYGCQALIQASAEETMSQLLQPKILALTDPSLDDALILPNHGSKAAKKSSAYENLDSLIVTEVKSSWPFSTDLRAHYITWKHSHKLQRFWSKSGSDKQSLMLVPENHLYTHKLGTWTCFLVRELQGNSTSGLTLMTVVTVPASDDFCHLNILKDRMTSQILCLREHVDSLYISRAMAAISSSEGMKSPGKNHPDAISNAIVDCVQDIKGNSPEEVPASVNYINMPEAESSSKSDRYVVPAAMESHKDLIKEAFDILYEVHKANADTPNWNYEGNSKGVEVYKMSGDSSCPCDCYKGTTEVQVPLSYALLYCHNLDNKLEWDDLFAGGSVVEEFDLINKIVHMEYKPVWPTSGRDFCSISCVRHLKGNLYGIAVKAVDYPDCPFVKGKVRGEIIIGGFLIEEISKNPPRTRVTYVTRADLKGHIPAKLVNKVSSAQPMYCVTIREKLEERLIDNDPPDDDTLLRFAHNYPSMFEEPKSASSESFVNRSNSDLVFDSANDKHVGDTEVSSNVSTSSSESTPKRNSRVTEGMKVSPCKQTDDDLSVCSSDIARELSPLDFEEDPLPLSDHDFDLPRDRRGHVDFLTLGNQASASLLEEALLVSRVEIREPRSEKEANVIGEWTYQGVKKDIKMFRKIHAKECVHSFLGCGVMEVLPMVVWDAIKNPATRFIYDNMLKKTKVARDIGKGYKIVHMRHETTACFVRQARDFVVLTSERVEDYRYVLSGISVDIPECPLEKDCVRGRVLSSGWIIEPILKNGKSCSKVTYLSQIHFGGRLPLRLINHIAKRQPLSVAYLREYLESSDHK